MADLAVLVPTRQRAERLAGLVEAIEQTAAGAVDVVACVDDDDPQLDDYRRIMLPAVGRLLVGPRQSLSGWTNFAADWVLNPANGSPPRYLASLGDDHMPRTPGWDVTLRDACGEVGWAYGDDLLQRAQLPTAWVQTANLARTLKWVMLPSCQHLYVDNAVLELGSRVEAIRYVPQVVIEHMHPIARKAVRDESYRASNSREQYARDQAAYRDWMAHGIEAAVAKVRRLQQVPVAR